jgi:hypothetical protein
VPLQETQEILSASPKPMEKAFFIGYGLTSFRQKLPNFCRPGGANKFNVKSVTFIGQEADKSYRAN